MSRVIVVLAAGASSRFGAPKALARWKGGTMLSHILATARAAGNAELLVVTGGHADRIAPACGNVRTVYNPDWRRGIGTSIATGTKAAREAGAGTLAVMTIDQPFVTASHLQNLLTRAQIEDRICFSRDGDIFVPPAAIPVSRFPLLSHLPDDKGLKFLAGDNDCVFLDAPGIMADIDTPEDHARWTAEGGG